MSFWARAISNSPALMALMLATLPPVERALARMPTLASFTSLAIPVATGK